MALQAGHYAEAEAKFREVTRQTPRLPEGHLNLGLALLREGNVPGAVASLEAAARLAPDMRGPHMFLAIAYFETGDLKQARAAVDREMQLTPQEPDVLTLAGTIALAQGDPAAAIPPLDRAALLTPNDLDLMDLQGRAYQAVAKHIYQEMYRIAPDSWQVHRVRGRLFADDQRYKESADEYEAAVAARPDNLDLYEELAMDYRHLNDLEKVEQTYSREKSQAPQNPHVLVSLAGVQIERGHAAEGVPLVEQALALSPNEPDAYFYLGRGEAELSRDDEAVAALERYTHTQPDGEHREQAYYTLARLYRKLQKPEQAEQALNEFQRMKQARETREQQQVDAFRKKQ